MALTKFNYNSFDVTPVASKALAFNSGANGLTTAAEGSMVLIKTLTASTSSTLEFVDGASDVVLDNTYPTYLIRFIDIHPSANGANFQVNFRDGGSSYDATKTSTAFGAQHNEAGTETGLDYDTGKDVAQGTGVQKLDPAGDTGNDNDKSGCGELWLFNPSSTTFVKHWFSRFHNYNITNYSIDSYTAGYCNVTAAIDGVQFSYSSGTIDAGTIKLYGIKDS